MKGGFAYADFDVLADLWNKNAPEKYALSPERLKSHTVEAPVFDLKTSAWHTFAGNLAGFISIKRSANPSLYAGPNAQQAHINLLGFADFKVAQDILAEAEATLRSAGIVRVVFGADSRHFFPGCPKDWPYLEDRLREWGYSGTDEGVDLECDLGTYAPPAGCLAPITPTESFMPSIVARPCQSADLPALRAFFAAEFPGRWEHDVLMKWNLEGPETVVGLFDGEMVVGFALIQMQGCRLPIGGAVWEKSLGPNWGSLGPIGISESVRGQGLGDALLAAGLVELQKRGARRTIIDWTTLVDFYGRHGFQVTRRYAMLAKDL